MQTRKKLFEIIDGVQKYCEVDGTYCCDCEHSGHDSESCWKYKIADAIIESGLLKDEKVHKPIYKYEENIEVDGKTKWTAYCSKCGEWLTDIFIAKNKKDFDNYCPNCGAKLKELQNEMS